MKPASATSEQLGWAALKPQVRALALVLASLAMLLMASTLTEPALIAAVMTVMLIAALLSWTRGPIGTVCGCTIAAELVFRALQNVPGPYLLGGGLVLFMGLHGTLFLFIRHLKNQPWRTGQRSCKAC